MASARALVSIALSMRNSEGTIVPAIRSLLAQSFRDWELMVLDDGSSDRSVELCARFADERVQVHRDGGQLGLAARLNQAIDLARGATSRAWMPTTSPIRIACERQVTLLQAHTEVDLLGAGMMVFEGDGTPVGVFPSRATHAEICARPDRRLLSRPSDLDRQARVVQALALRPRLAQSRRIRTLLLRSFSRVALRPSLSRCLVIVRMCFRCASRCAGVTTFRAHLLRVARSDGRILHGLRASGRAGSQARVGVGCDLERACHARCCGIGRCHSRRSRREAWRVVWAACHDASCAVPGRPAAL